MSETHTDAVPDSSTRGGRSRGSHKPRGGLGKYLRARGRGRGRGRGGRPAEWGQRLLLDGEGVTEDDDEERVETERKYARRELGTNADRYVEPEPELDSDGEEIAEPEVDLSAFLERQRLSLPSGSSSVPGPPDEDDDVDTSIALISSLGGQAPARPQKGKVQQIEWDASLEDMRREKAAAEAKWDLKNRFRAQVTNQRDKLGNKVASGTARPKDDRKYVEAPLLPVEQKQKKTGKDGMQDFLDDLLG